MTEAPFVSVITVTLDEAAALATTRDGLLALFDQDFEWLVQHGGQDPAIREVAGPRADHVGAPDDGLYDAMNRAMARARGGWLWFLNAGDRPADASIIAALKRIANDADLILAPAIERDVNGLRSRQPVRPLTRLWLGLPTSHQAILYRRRAVAGLRYPAAYRIAADYAFTVQAARLAKKTVIADFPVAETAPPGLSARHSALGRAEQAQLRADLLGLWPIPNGAIRLAQAGMLTLRRRMPGLYRRLRRDQP